MVTKEVNVSPSFQCRKSHIERRQSVILLNELKKVPIYSSLFKEKILRELGYLDPIKAFFDKTHGTAGTYKYRIN